METTAGEAVETVAEMVDAVPVIVKSNPVAIASAAIGGALIGASVTYFIVNRRLKKKYEQIAEDEIRQAKVFYRKLNEKEDLVGYAEKDIEKTQEIYESQTDMLKEAAKVVDERGYVSYDKTAPAVEQTVAEKVEVEESIRSNIFEDEGKRAPELTRTLEEAKSDDFDLDDELEKKAKGQPYILEAEEFYENESGYSQTNLTWYEEDMVLADERDRMIRDWMEIIGHDNLQFGRGSKDRNVVFVRNDRLQGEYEIVRSQGSFSREVMGIDEEALEHSDQPRIRRFRNTD